MILSDILVSYDKEQCKSLPQKSNRALVNINVTEPLLGRRHISIN